MKKLSLLLMTGLTMSFAFGKPGEMREVVIAGKVINITEKTPKVIKFNFCNPLIPGAKSSQLNAKGEFVARQDMMYIQNMTVHFLNYFINLYVKPGDSVHLTIDAAKLDQPNFAWLTIEGDHALISTQLNLCVNYMYRLPVHSNNLDLPPAAMLQALKQDYERYMIALNKYTEENKIDPLVKEWAEMDTKYLISNQIVDYGSGRNSPVDKKAFMCVYSDPFFNMYDPENFRSMMFPHHLSNYVYSLLRTDSTIAVAVTENRPVDAARNAMTSILKQPAGECRDYMLNQYLSSYVNRYPGILDSLKNVNTLFTKTVYYKALKELSETITKPVFPETIIKGMNYLTAKGITSPLPEADAFSYLKTKYPGKVIYIDVYATWCGPCLEEMYSAPALQKSLKGENIVFVNLCLQSTETNWKKLVKERNIEGENYFFTDDATKLFMGTYRLLGYPSYILIDKQGRIVTTNPPRPSDSAALKKAISTLIDN